MNKGFRLKSQSRITLTVNDLGEEISFDISDPSFLSGAQRMIKTIEDFNSNMKSDGRLEEFENFLDSDIDEDTLLSEEAMNFGNLAEEYFIVGKRAVDEFLGAGSSKKLFIEGDYLNMFNDLFDNLEPYLEQSAKILGTKQKEIDDIREKYAAKERSKKVI